MTESSHLHPVVAHLDDEQLSPAEWARLAAIPISEEERAETRELIRWFKRRYPSVKERFAYVRRKYAEVTRRPIAIRAASGHSAGLERTGQRARLERDE